MAAIRWENGSVKSIAPVSKGYVQHCFSRHPRCIPKKRLLARRPGRLFAFCKFAEMPVTCMKITLPPAPPAASIATARRDRGRAPACPRKGGKTEAFVAPTLFLDDEIDRERSLPRAPNLPSSSIPRCPSLLPVLFKN